MIDEKDEMILEELKKDSRQSTADISRHTKIPRVTVHERIKRLKEKGIIKRFTIQPDHSKLDGPTTAFVLVSYSPHHNTHQREVAQKIAKLPGVYEVHLIAGEWDLLLKVRGRSIEDIGKLILDKMREIPGVEKTFTMASFGMVKEEI